MKLSQLAKILEQNYNNAYNGEMVVQIHLFGIKYGKIIREKKFTAIEIITQAKLNESYVAELNKGIKLASSIIIENDDDDLQELAKILKNNYENAKRGQTVAQIFLFGIKYGQIIRRKNMSISEIIRHSTLKESYYAELNKGVKLSKYISAK